LSFFAEESPQHPLPIASSLSKSLAELAELSEAAESGFGWGGAAEGIVGVYRVGSVVCDKVEQPVNCFQLPGEGNG
jgi:hypothetical protein